MAFASSASNASDGRGVQDRDAETPDRATCHAARIHGHPGAIATAWRALEKRVEGPSFYQGVDWCSAWLEGCLGAREPQDIRIIAIWQAERLVLVWPLVRTLVGGIGVLRPMGTPGVQYADVLIDRGAPASPALSAAMRCIAAMPDVSAVRLAGVRADARLFGLTGESVGWAVTNPRVSPDFSLIDAAAGRKRRSGRSLAALRRHRRRLDAIGDVVLEAVPAAELERETSATLAMKAQWQDVHSAASAAYLHPANGAAMRALARSGRFRATRLTVDGHTVATEIGVNDAGRYLSMLQAYDLAYTAYAPGRLLLQYTLDHLDPDVTAFDFLPPSQPHKSEWTGHGTAVTDRSFAFDARGRAALAYLERFRPVLVSAFRAMPGPARGFVLRRLG